MSARRRYWLMKTEPDTFSIDDLERVRTEPWNGVRNYQARNFMRDGMKVGDGVLFYHSNTDVPGIVGTATVSSKAYPASKDYFDRYAKLVKESGQPQSARSLWLGIRLERVFGNKDAEASLALQLKNNHPYSPEYLEYQNSLKK